MSLIPVWLRDSLPSLSPRRWLRGGSSATAKIASMALFLLLLAMTVTVAFTASSILAAAIATFILFFMLRAVLPTGRIDALVKALWSGEAGVRAGEWLAARYNDLKAVVGR